MLLCLSFFVHFCSFFSGVFSKSCNAVDMQQKRFSKCCFQASDPHTKTQLQTQNTTTSDYFITPAVMSRLLLLRNVNTVLPRVFRQPVQIQTLSRSFSVLPSINSSRQMVVPSSSSSLQKRTYFGIFDYNEKGEDKRVSQFIDHVDQLAGSQTEGKMVSLVNCFMCIAW